MINQIDAWLRARTFSSQRDDYLPTEQLEAFRQAMASGRADHFQFRFKRAPAFSRAMGHVPGAGLEHYGSHEMAPFDIPLDSANLTSYVTHDRTVTGGDFLVPGDDDSLTTGRIIDDTTQATETDIVTTQIKLKGFRLTSDGIGVHESLMTETPNYAEYVLGRLARRLIKAQEKYCLQGVGTTEPLGLNSQATDSGISISAASVTYDQLVDIEQSVNQDYRERSIWVAHPATVAGLKKIVDTAGRPAYIPQTPLGEWPATIMGHPLIETPRCPTDWLFFGDFSFVHWRESEEVRLIRSTEARAEYNQTYFLAEVVFDSGLGLISSGDPPLTRSAVG